MRKNLISSVVILVVGAVLLTGVNAFTAPIIEKNNASKSNGVLLTVMPNASGFEALYEADKAEESTLKDVANTVVGVYKETSGLGFVINLSTTEGYTHEPMTITVGVDAEGKICGVNLTAYPETKDFGVDTYPNTYVGQDSTLADVTLVSGCTYASVAFKNAVSDGFATLVANDLLKAAQKGAGQIIKEQLPTIFSGAANAAGVLQTTPISCDADEAFLANNGSGAAFISGDKVVVINSSLVGAVYTANIEDETLVDVTESNSDLVEKYVTVAASNIKSVTEKDANKVAKFAGSDATALQLGTFNTVISGFKLANGNYGFVTRPYGYGNECMVVTYVLNAKGEIVKMNADEFILIAEYFTNYTLNEKDYVASFNGLTSDSFTDQYLISGATVSSDAIKAATSDVFAAFAAVTGGK